MLRRRHRIRSISTATAYLTSDDDPFDDPHHLARARRDRRRRSRADAMLARLAEIARDRAAAIEPHLSYLIISVPEEHHVDGLEVWRDHVPLDRGAWNRAIPLDGGAHLIEARVPGHETWSTTVA